jgi:protein ImuA
MNKAVIIEQLQKQILSMQEKHKGDTRPSEIGLGIIESAFPGEVFPRAAIHEFISSTPENSASSNAFISVILGKLMQQTGCCMWIGSQRSIYPAALRNFGIEPHRILFVNTLKQKDLLWILEEALKCEALTAVVGEIPELGFNESRRLQLAVEKSHVTGFIHRFQPKAENVVACVTRWKIKPIPSCLEQGMPGVGFPRWNVELVKVRNGKPGEWQLEWTPDGLAYIVPEFSSDSLPYEIKLA